MKENIVKCGIDISPRGIERILIAGTTDEQQAEAYALLSRLAPRLSALSAAAVLASMDEK